jgi:hypothetical protein
MADIDILLDSNIYFHFAIDCHPLLPGDYQVNSDNYHLSVIDDLQSEFESSPRLQSKFYWIKEERYVENRANNIVDISSLSEKDIDNTVTYLKSFSTGSASPADLRAFAIAEIMELTIATDDLSMQQISDQIGLEYYTSLNMLELLYHSGTVDKVTLKRIVNFWVHNNDEPYGGIINDIEEIFEIVIDS